MKEIGGYFGLEQLMDKPYYSNMIELNTGRNALIYLTKTKKLKKIYIPYYLCNSVGDILTRYCIEFEYYHVNTDFFPLFEKNLGEGEYLYIVNYYGQISNNIIHTLKEKFKHIIVDNTQAFFQEPVSDVDTIYSCRKFFGVPDGAYLYTDILLERELDIDVSKDRMTHILGRFEGQASDYYSNFQINDKSFKELPLMKMSKLTKNILGAIDYELVKQIRSENFQYLAAKLSHYNKLDVIIQEGAFAYPYFVKNGLEVRKLLAHKKIYIPTLWPNVLRDNAEDSIEYNYTANILPLPCDQRYTKEDMSILIQELMKCID